jgi:hypothetical protein
VSSFLRSKERIVKTIIEQDLGADPSTGTRVRRLHEVITQPEDYPGLDDDAVEDLHAALVELERLDFVTRHAARQQIERTGLDPISPAGTIRRAIYLTNRQKIFH